MTKTHLTRRAALAGSVALPLAPAAALATAEIPHFVQAADEVADPAVAAFEEWRAAQLAANESGLDDDDPEGAAIWTRYDRAEDFMATVIPKTPEEIACKARFACNLFAGLMLDGDPGEPDDYDDWLNSRARPFIDSLLTYAERLAGRAVA